MQEPRNFHDSEKLSKIGRHAIARAQRAAQASTEGACRSPGNKQTNTFSNRWRVAALKALFGTFCRHKKYRIIITGEACRVPTHLA